MNNSEIITGLRELAEERRTWFREDGDDEQFRRDYAVLTAAAEFIGESELPEKCNACSYIEERDWTQDDGFCPNCGARMDGEKA